ncbi:uncharacterized protein LOC5572686 [Aedes aegypti]|uniref:DUF4729 domain-containing protein n=1 Tax=Aedes aegypti TaxID=7159 RepID=A0A1S4FNV8_AEDAE|nr:uncharacterized protein LOC5572686 [Aedes aegypti]
MKDPSEPKPNTRNPWKCPIMRCPTMLSDSALLDHLIAEHKCIDLKPVEAGEKALLSFRESIFPYGQPVCMGVLLYGGKGNQSSPGHSHRNSILSASFAAYEKHLPVLVMGCKTHLTDMLADDEIPSEIYNDICQRRDAALNGSDRDKDIFVLWLIGPSTSRPVYGEVTISDVDRIIVRGCRMQMHDFKDFLLPKSFLCNGEDYLMVNRPGMSLMTRNGEQDVEMEVVIEEEKTEI